MNLISLTLFSTQSRYWYTLLPALLANWELYPGWKIRLHLAGDARAHAASKILDIITDQTDRLQVFEYGDAYQGTEPTIWRMRPLWDPNVERFLCRDIDSVPSTGELQSVNIWMRKAQPVQSIRSYHLHTTLLMAGLCGFATTPLKFLRDQVPSFENYVAWGKANCPLCANFDWGCDQELLRLAFNTLVGYILDFPIGNCPYNPPFISCITKEEIAAEPLPGLNSDLLAICNEITDIPWGEYKGFAGRPHGDFRQWFAKMLRLPLPMAEMLSKILEQNPEIKSFYTV